VLSTLVSVYEDARWPIDAPDAVDVLRYVMDQRNLSASDLVPYIGQRGHVYDVLNRRRRLSLAMIQRLSEPLIDRRSPGRAIRRHAVPALSVPRRKGLHESRLYDELNRAAGELAQRIVQDLPEYDKASWGD
jgi:hypothetical protein